MYNVVFGITVIIVRQYSLCAGDDLCPVYLFCQLKEASVALQKTTQQVQKLVQMVNKPSSGTSLLRSPGQPQTQSGEHMLLRAASYLYTPSGMTS